MGTRRRAGIGLLLLALGVGALWGLIGPRASRPRPAPEPAAAPEAVPTSEPPPWAPTSPLLEAVRADPAAYRRLVEAARDYFDLEEELWRGRQAFLRELERHAARDERFLADLPALRWLVAQGRSFLPPLTDRTWQRMHAVREARSLGGTLRGLRSEHLSITYSVPRHDSDLRAMRRFPRADPLPLLVALHEAGDDTGSGYPGAVLLERLHAARSVWRPLYEDWLVLAPSAAAGGFVVSDKPHAEGFLQPFSVFWKHHHVDFDRVVLDGGRDAFSIAASMPVFFAGVVLRGGWALEEDRLDEVRNFASVPVYVVDDVPLARRLVAAGHPWVTAGDGGADLLAWMTRRRRRLPTRFAWTAKRSDQVLPWWINLDAPNWDAAKRELEVEVVDTDEAPNTIRIDAVGIEDLSVFLNDEIVDLDGPVRLVVNGHVEHDGPVALQDPKMAAVGRDFDYLFKREPLIIRDSMYFGWLTPARLVRVEVRPPR